MDNLRKGRRMWEELWPTAVVTVAFTTSMGHAARAVDGSAMRPFITEEEVHCTSD